MKTAWLVLADHADIVGNKLYLNGGGWDVLNVNTPFPVNQLCGLAAAFEVDWNETNQRHNVEIEIVSGEDHASIAKFGAQIEVGRPAGLPPGQSQRAQIAANMVLTLNGPGVYEIVSRVEGQESERVHFNVVAGPGVRA